MTCSAPRRETDDSDAQEGSDRFRGTYAALDAAGHHGASDNVPQLCHAPVQRR